MTETQPAVELRRAQADYWVYFDGEMRRYGDSHLGLLTHALHYGTGCFEGIRAYWSERQRRLNVFRMADHFERMRGNARMLHMEVPLPVEELCAITVELLRRNGFTSDVYVRPLVYKANEEVGIRFHDLRDGFMIVTVPFGAYVDTTAGIRCQVSSWRRMDDTIAPARSKSTGIYVNSALAKTEACLNGFDEAIVLTQGGHVSEGSAENIFLLRGGRLITPPVTENIVEGITRRTLMTFAREELGIDVVERVVDRSELYVADEVILSGTGAEVSPVIEIDRRPIADGEPGRVTRRLQKLYFDVCKGEDDRYASWLTPVA
ncbi:MAG TPA: branched-chain amino acid transaminase [Candidatus Dormibacteraeota bacterium]|nr:branched-chain amino acid transaminase [Candidatus Dormibacteraeota bacterium]